MADEPKQQRMQREKSELPAAMAFDVERLAQVTFVREDMVVGHVCAPHRLAQLARNRNVFEFNKRLADVRRSIDYRNDLKLAYADEDDEDQAASQDKDEERVAQTLILPETNEPLVVEQLSEFCQQA